MKPGTGTKGSGDLIAAVMPTSKLSSDQYASRIERIAAIMRRPTSAVSIDRSRPQTPPTEQPPDGGEFSRKLLDAAGARERKRGPFVRPSSCGRRLESHGPASPSTMTLRMVQRTSLDAEQLHALSQVQKGMETSDAAGNGAAGFAAMEALVVVLGPDTPEGQLMFQVLQLVRKATFLDSVPPLGGDPLDEAVARCIESPVTDSVPKAVFHATVQDAVRSKDWARWVADRSQRTWGACRAFRDLWNTDQTEVVAATMNQTTPTASGTYQPAISVVRGSGLAVDLDKQGGAAASIASTGLQGPFIRRGPKEKNSTTAARMTLSKLRHLILSDGSEESRRAPPDLTNSVRTAFLCWRAVTRRERAIDRWSNGIDRRRSTVVKAVTFTRWHAAIQSQLAERRAGSIQLMESLIFNERVQRNALTSQSQSDRSLALTCQAEINRLQEQVYGLTEQLRALNSPMVIDFRRPLVDAHGAGELRAGVIRFRCHPPEIAPAISYDDYFFDLSAEPDIEGVATPNKPLAFGHYAIRVDSTTVTAQAEALQATLTPSEEALAWLSQRAFLVAKKAYTDILDRGRVVPSAAADAVDWSINERCSNEWTNQPSERRVEAVMTALAVSYDRYIKRRDEVLDDATDFCAELAVKGVRNQCLTSNRSCQEYLQLTSVTQLADMPFVYFTAAVSTLGVQAVDGLLRDVAGELQVTTFEDAVLALLTAMGCADGVSAEDFVHRQPNRRASAPSLELAASVCMSPKMRTKSRHTMAVSVRTEVTHLVLASRVFAYMVCHGIATELNGKIKLSTVSESSDQPTVFSEAAPTGGGDSPAVTHFTARIPKTIPTLQEYTAQHAATKKANWLAYDVPVEDSKPESSLALVSFGTGGYLLRWAHGVLGARASAISGPLASPNAVDLLDLTSAGVLLLARVASVMWSQLTEGEKQPPEPAWLWQDGVERTPSVQWDAYAYALRCGAALGCQLPQGLLSLGDDEEEVPRINSSLVLQLWTALYNRHQQDEVMLRAWGAPIPQVTNGDSKKSQRPTSKDRREATTTAKAAAARNVKQVVINHLLQLLNHADIMQSKHTTRGGFLGAGAQPALVAQLTEEQVKAAIEVLATLQHEWKAVCAGCVCPLQGTRSNDPLSHSTLLSYRMVRRAVLTSLHRVLQAPLASAIAADPNISAVRPAALPAAVLKVADSITADAFAQFPTLNDASLVSLAVATDVLLLVSRLSSDFLQSATSSQPGSDTASMAAALISDLYQAASNVPSPSGETGGPIFSAAITGSLSVQGVSKAPTCPLWAMALEAAFVNNSLYIHPSSSAALRCLDARAMNISGFMAAIATLGLPRDAPARSPTHSDRRDSMAVTQPSILATSAFKSAWLLRCGVADFFSATPLQPTAASFGAITAGDSSFGLAPPSMGTSQPEASRGTPLKASAFRFQTESEPCLNYSGFCDAFAFLLKASLGPTAQWMSWPSLLSSWAHQQQFRAMNKVRQSDDGTAEFDPEMLILSMSGASLPPVVRPPSGIVEFE